MKISRSIPALILALLMLGASLLPVPGRAMTLALPGVSTLAAQKSRPAGSYLLPVGAWENGKMKTLPTEGRISQQAWRLTQSGLTSLQLLEILKKQIVAAGFTVIFNCDTQACGGFDFRYNTDVLPEPEMHVDLGDFRFLSAKRTNKSADPKDTAKFLSLLISTSGRDAFVQLTQVGQVNAAGLPPVEMAVSTKSPDPLASPPVAPTGANTLADCTNSLEKKGRFILEDLIFKTGSSTLQNEKFASLTSLAQYLKAHPDKQVVVVGHTDARGSLVGNIALSRKRALAVSARLVADYGVDKRQLSSQGMGYLAPRDSNLTEAGRSRNRRVEVILTSTK